MRQLVDSLWHLMHLFGHYRPSKSTKLCQLQKRDFQRQKQQLESSITGLMNCPNQPEDRYYSASPDQLTHFMALLLWVAGALAFVSGTPELGWAIWAVIWINAGFSFWQEFQATGSVAWSPDGQTLVSAGEGDMTAIWIFSSNK